MAAKRIVEGKQREMRTEAGLSVTVLSPALVSSSEAQAKSGWLPLRHWSTRTAIKGYLDGSGSGYVINGLVFLFCFCLDYSVRV